MSDISLGPDEGFDGGSSTDAITAVSPAEGSSSHNIPTLTAKVTNPNAQLLTVEFQLMGPGYTDTYSDKYTI